MGYSKWDNFVKVIIKAKTSCEASDNNIADHFADVGKMVTIGLGTEREIQDIMLTRYACYLIAQNRAPRKESNESDPSTITQFTRQVVMCA
ncbi:MAG: hypothetical protein PF444_01220 [Bacteroidales bacterium]|nr:hypothetical protein [Bacteroidales bacterium]